METVFYILLGLALVAALIYAGVVSVSVFKEITFLRWRRRMLAAPIPKPFPELVPVPVRPEDLAKEIRRSDYQVRFAGRWYGCHLVYKDVRSGLGVVHLMDPRTHSRRIVRRTDEIKLAD